MQRQLIDSSAIASIGYDPDQEELEVEFASGNIYRYFAVPADVFQELLQASSKGRFFGENIRGQYESARA